ncbi:MAG: hypothetical protein AAF990_00890 [Bacteroidota bacterium]
MRNALLFSFLLMSLWMTSCTGDASSSEETTIKKASELIASQQVDDKTQLSNETGVPVPQWVADVLKRDPEKTRVIRCVYEGTNLYLINTCITCGQYEQVTEVFNEKKELICYIGGPESKITCDDAGFGSPGKRDCEPIFLEGM